MKIDETLEFTVNVSGEGTDHTWEFACDPSDDGPYVTIRSQDRNGSAKERALPLLETEFFEVLKRLGIAPRFFAWLTSTAAQAELKGWNDGYNAALSEVASSPGNRPDSDRRMDDERPPNAVSGKICGAVTAADEADRPQGPSKRSVSRPGPSQARRTRHIPNSPLELKKPRLTSEESARLAMACAAISEALVEFVRAKSMLNQRAWYPYSPDNIMGPLSYREGKLDMAITGIGRLVTEVRDMVTSDAVE